MKTILVTGGRAPVALELARLFARAGHRVLVAESIPIHLCRYSRMVAKNYQVPPPNQEPRAYIDALIRIVQSEHVDLLVPTCEEIFFIAQGLESLQAYCSVFVAPIEQMQHMHNKWTIHQSVRESDLPAPTTHLLRSQADLRSYLAQQQQSFTPFVLKPAYSRFATQVYIIDEQRQIAHLATALLDPTISASSPWLAQEKIVGQAFCSYSIAHQGKLNACIHFQAVVQPDIDRWVCHFLRHIQFSGQIAFDFIVAADNTVYALECNPRATSGVHLFRPSDGLQQAFLYPAQQQAVIRPQAGAQAMIAIAMLLYAPPVIFRSWSRLRQWFDAITHAHDVIFAWDDACPFLAQPLILCYNWRSSRQHRRSMLANSTYDIEWNGQL